MSLCARVRIKTYMRRQACVYYVALGQVIIRLNASVGVKCYQCSSVVKNVSCYIMERSVGLYGSFNLI